MTELGLYLAKRSINKSEIARKTGITKVRLSDLTLKEGTHLRAKELYLIALAIYVNPAEMFTELYKDVKLEQED